MSEKKTQVEKEVKAPATEKAEKKTAPAAKEAAPAAKKDAAPAAKPMKRSGKPRLHTLYESKAVGELIKRFKYKNVNQVPRLEKIVINSGFGDIKDNAKSLQLAVEELRQIAGQKPLTTKAKKSIANFKVRENMSIGAKVTLRGARMYEFADKLINIALPRVRDFRGVSSKSFDGRGNYAMGVREQLIFPEITYDQVEKIRGYDICFVTTAETDEEARELLKLLGMPFRA